MLKKIFTCLLTMLGLNSACSQPQYETLDAQSFDDAITNQNCVVLDVRTADEYRQSHIDGAINIDVKSAHFLTSAKQQLPQGRTIAVYCRSGRRSANAATLLTGEGFNVINLDGGIIAWEKAGKQVTAGPAYEVDTFTTPSGKTVKFHALMHASIRIQYDGIELQIDPVTKLGDRQIDYSAMPHAHYILVTHEHGDHLDKNAIESLTGDNTQLITNVRCADILGRGKVMANGDHLVIGNGITVDAVPAYNTTEGHLQFHPKGRDNGFVITLDGMRIYIAGDTEDIPEMAALTDIDVAFLPCNQPYTMTPDQLVKAARMIKPRVLFPYHYGQTDISGLPAMLQADSIDVRIRNYQ